MVHLLGREHVAQRHGAPVTATIEETLQEYFDGLHHSDTNRLRRAFHPKALYATATGGVLVHHTMDDYFPIVDARPSPASRNEQRRDRLVSIQQVGPVMAVARVECAIGPQRFDDVLTLVLLDGRWQIIAKVFHYELAEEA